MEKLEFTLKPVKNLDKWVHDNLYDHYYIWYRRKGKYAECKCTECGQKYVLRTTSTGDPFEDDCIDIEMPSRDKPTKCRKCGVKAHYKPAGHTKTEWHYKYVLTGEKITDDQFIFRIFDTTQRINAGQQTLYHIKPCKLIVCEKGSKPVRYENWLGGWNKSGTGEQYRYAVHPSTFREIKKTGMYKYVPVPENVSIYWDDCWVIDFYIAAARYPDFEMLIKMGLDDIWQRLMKKMPVNFNPRGKTIEDRLRIYKSHLKNLAAHKGDHNYLFYYQLEKRYGAHWSDKDFDYIDTLRNCSFEKKYETVLKYTTPTRLKNYMEKQKMWPNIRYSYRESQKRSDMRRTYFDYIEMRNSAGYEMNDIQLFPRDFRQRHDEMVIEAEKAKLDKRIKEVSTRFPSIKRRYAKLSEKYSAEAGGYIIRPARDAAEIVTEGRILHHCVGTDRYLEKHNKGTSAILFLRPIKDKDNPFITVEIKDEQIIQWYGAYDKKPQMKMIEAWLEKYIKELKKHEKMLKNDKKSPKTAKKSKKTKQNVSKTA